MNSYLLIFAGLLLLTDMLRGQTLQQKNRDYIRIVFYNVENYFDTEDDSLTNDEEFLPSSAKNWNNYRLHKKSLNIFKVLAEAGQSQPPDIVGFAEIENSSVLQKLIYDTPLNTVNYGIIHYDSPDLRGIDVGMIYRKDRITPVSSKPLRIRFPENPAKRTRDILYVKAVLPNLDTLHLFINHWPSRRGGQQRSEPGRLHTGQFLRHHIDSLLHVDPCSRIVITGDFNDEPENLSLTESLGAKTRGYDSVSCEALYNLAAYRKELCGCGTYRYRHAWNMLDQFIVSGSLLMQEEGAYTCPECFMILDTPFLLVPDEKYGGVKPDRTYLGPRYLGGFSDHLPIMLDIYLN